MHRHLLILPDGREIFSGPEQENALQSVTVTQCVNSGEELTLGSACACELGQSSLPPMAAFPWPPGMWSLCLGWMRRTTGSRWVSSGWKNRCAPLDIP